MSQQADTPIDRPSHCEKCAATWPCDTIAALDGPGGRWPPHVHSWGPLKAIPPDGEQGRECSGCLEYQRERTDD